MTILRFQQYLILALLTGGVAAQAEFKPQCHDRQKNPPTAPVTPVTDNESQRIANFLSQNGTNARTLNRELRASLGRSSRMVIEQYRRDMRGQKVRVTRADRTAMGRLMLLRRAFPSASCAAGTTAGTTTCTAGTFSVTVPDAAAQAVNRYFGAPNGAAVGVSYDQYLANNNNVGVLPPTGGDTATLPVVNGGATTTTGNIGVVAPATQ